MDGLNQTSEAYFQNLRKLIWKYVKKKMEM